MQVGSSSVFASRQIETYASGMGADRGHLPPGAPGRSFTGEGLLESLVAAGGAFTFSFFLDALSLVAPGAAMPDFQWQDAAGRRLLTPQELLARQQYFNRRARLAIARTKHAAA